MGFCSFNLKCYENFFAVQVDEKVWLKFSRSDSKEYEIVIEKITTDKDPVKLASFTLHRRTIVMYTNSEELYGDECDVFCVSEISEKIRDFLLLFNYNIIPSLSPSEAEFIVNVFEMYERSGYFNKIKGI